MNHDGRASLISLRVRIYIIIIIIIIILLAFLNIILEFLLHSVKF